MATLGGVMDPLAAPFAVAALLLVLAGAQKANDPAPAQGALRALGLPDRRRLVQLGAVAELIIGAGALVIDGSVFPALVAASYLAFMVFVLAALRSGTPIESCGCFGREDTPPSLVHVIVNAGFAATATAVAIAGGIDLAEILADQPWSGVPFVLLVGLGAWLVTVAFTQLARTLELVRQGTAQ